MLFRSIRVRLSFGTKPYDHSGFRPTQSLLPDISGMMMAVLRMIPRAPALFGSVEPDHEETDVRPAWGDP
jgi:hypothetical protein